MESDASDESDVAEQSAVKSDSEMDQTQSANASQVLEPETGSGAEDGDAQTSEPSDDTKRSSKRGKGGRSSKKKRKNADSEDDVDEKTTRKSRGGKKKSVVETDYSQLDSNAVAEELGINDVELEYSDDDFDNLTDFSAYTEHIRPLIAQDNSRVAHSKLNILLQAKWREFLDIHPDKSKIVDESAELKSPSKKLPTLRIKVGGQGGAADEDKKNGDSSKKSKRKRKRRREDGGGDTSDEEFERQLEELEEQQAQEELLAQQKPKPLKKGKGKGKKKGPSKKKLEESGAYDTNHNDFCEVCKAGGEVVLCDNCPRSYHLVCLDPPLEEADLPEGKWVCPECTKEGITAADLASDESEPSEHNEFCRTCKEGGELICCDSCPSSYHLRCLNPPLKDVPPGDWRCPRCSCEPLTAPIEKIHTWRWSEPPKEDSMDHSHPEAIKFAHKPTREFFVKYKGLSYWHCEWISELQLDVFHPVMYRNYASRVGMQEPPVLDDGSAANTDVKMEEQQDPHNLEERFYRYGVRPEWLQVHRIINHKPTPKGVTWYLIKWVDMPYNHATWEIENGEIPDMEKKIEEYWARRELAFGPQEGRKKGSKKDKAAGVAKRRDPSSSDAIYFKPPPNHPTTDLSVQYEKQPPFFEGTLHPYQLEGINWLRYSWYHGNNTILADEMGLGKTIQTITFLLTLYKEGHCKGPFLIAAPLSTITNWEREFEVWAPELYVVNYTGDKECRAVIRENEFCLDENAIRGGAKATKLKSGSQVKFQALLTSYELISIDNSCLSSIDWACLVVDEAHRLKNNQSKFFRILNSYKVGYKLLLTGTPLQNNLEELYNLLNFLEPGRFNDLQAFLDKFSDISKEDQIKTLHDMIGPHMLRRLKADVLKNMPTKSEFIIRIDMTPMQRKYYKFILTRNFEALNSKGGNQVSLLNIMMDLKKMCNHPYLFPVCAQDAQTTNDGRYDGAALVRYIL